MVTIPTYDTKLLICRCLDNCVMYTLAYHGYRELPRCFGMLPLGSMPNCLRCSSCIPTGRLRYNPCMLTVLSFIDDDLLFTDTNFTLSLGNRICFDVIIIDDGVIENTKSYGFYLHLQNGTSHIHFYDRTLINVTDNEGWFPVDMTSLLTCC